LNDNDNLKEDSNDWDKLINPNSLIIAKDCIAEPFVENARPEEKFQFIRHGYFCVDNKYTTNNKLVFNRIVPLKDSWKNS
jgi:glutaminyl-tRNA synthetase